MAEQRAVEVERVGPGFLHRLRLAVGDVGAGLDDQVVGRDAVTVLGQAARVVADDVLAQAARAAPAGRNRNVVAGGPLDRLLAAGHRHPHRRVRLLHRPRPDRDVLVGPEAARRTRTPLPSRRGE